MKQNYAPLEILVIDAGSTDGTQDLVRRVPNTRLERQSGTGLWQAWNQAIQQISTPLIAMIDSDDLWEPGAIEVHVAALKQNPEAVASVGLTRFFSDDAGRSSGSRPGLLSGSHRGLIPGATMFRREVFDLIGRFREDIPTTSDVEWFLRLRQSGLTLEEPDFVILAKRIHSDNLSATFPKLDQYDHDLIRIARESIQRQTQASQRVQP